MAKYFPVLESGTRTVSTSSALFKNWENQNALHLVVDITSGANLSVSILGYDEISNQTYTILSKSVATGTEVLRVGPELTAAAGVAKDYLPASWKVTAVPSGSTTFSIGASVI